MVGFAEHGQGEQSRNVEREARSGNKSAWRSGAPERDARRPEERAREKMTLRVRCPGATERAR